MIRDNSKYKLLINNIIQNISSLNLNNIPKSFCHGDLSLSNILFDNKDAYIIYNDDITVNISKYYKKI
jgi:thiamine kinase-like enzyme